MVTAMRYMCRLCIDETAKFGCATISGIIESSVMHGICSERKLAAKKSDMKEDNTLFALSFPKLAKRFGNGRGWRNSVRMATTEALKWVNLRGLIQFLKLGGSFDELDPTDVRKFDARMGKEAKQYRYPLLGIRSLTEAQINALIDLQREAEQRCVFWT